MFEIGQRVILKTEIGEQCGLFGTVCGLEHILTDSGITQTITAERITEDGRHMSFSGPADGVILYYDQPQPLLDFVLQAKKNRTRTDHEH